MIKEVKTSECTIEIEPSKNSWIRRDRNPEQEYRLCEIILSDIKRHVDDIGWTHISQKLNYETSDGSSFDTLYEALEYENAEDYNQRSFVYEYKRPSDDGVKSSGRLYDFKDVIVKAYECPWDFYVRSNNLDDCEWKFLQNVIESRLKILNK